MWWVQCWGVQVSQLIKPGRCSPLRALSRSSLSLSRSLTHSRSHPRSRSRSLSLSLAPSRPPSKCTLELCLSLWQAGFYGANGEPCTPCRAGTYKSWVGEGPCDKCPGGTFQAGTGGTGAAVCSPCPPTKISLPGSSACLVNSLAVFLVLSLFLPSSLSPSLPPFLPHSLLRFL